MRKRGAPCWNGDELISPCAGSDIPALLKAGSTFPFGMVNLVPGEDQHMSIKSVSRSFAAALLVAGLAACFRTDEGRMGKLRFQDADDDADIEWALW